MAGVKRYPILMISAVSASSAEVSRSLERLYPRSASSKKSVSSPVDLSSAPKNWNEPDNRCENQVCLNPCVSGTVWFATIRHEILKNLGV